MYKYHHSCLLVCLLLLSFPVTAQTIITGSVTDTSTEKPIPYATIFFKNNVEGTASNEKGVFSLTVTSLMYSHTSQLQSFHKRFLSRSHYPDRSGSAECFPI